MGVTDFQGGISDYKGKEDKGSIFNDEPMLGEITLFNNDKSMFNSSMFSGQSMYSGQSMFNTPDKGGAKSLFNPVPERDKSLFNKGEFTTGRSFVNEGSFVNTKSSKPVKKKRKRAGKAQKAQAYQSAQTIQLPQYYNATPY